MLSQKFNNRAYTCIYKGLSLAYLSQHCAGYDGILTMHMWPRTMSTVRKMRYLNPPMTCAAEGWPWPFVYVFTRIEFLFRDGIECLFKEEIDGMEFLFIFITNSIARYVTICQRWRVSAVSYFTVVLDMYHFYFLYSGKNFINMDCMAIWQQKVCQECPSRLSGKFMM